MLTSNWIIYAVLIRTKSIEKDNYYIKNKVKIMCVCVFLCVCVCKWELPLCTSEGSDNSAIVRWARRAAKDPIRIGSHGDGTDVLLSLIHI